MELLESFSTQEGAGVSWPIMPVLSGNTSFLVLLPARDPRAAKVLLWPVSRSGAIHGEAAL